MPILLLPRDVIDHQRRHVHEQIISKHNGKSYNRGLYKVLGRHIYDHLSHCSLIFRFYDYCYLGDNKNLHNIILLFYLSFSSKCSKGGPFYGKTSEVCILSFCLPFGIYFSSDL